MVPPRHTGVMLGFTVIIALAAGLQAASPGSRRVRRKAVWDEDHMWPNATIPYTVTDEVLESRRSMGAIRDAMRHIEGTTCIQFVQFPPEELPNYSDVKFTQFIKGNGCSSSVGKGQGIGAQNVSVGQGCAYTEKLIHELGHLIGLWHEHARADRDNNVVILWNNIQPKMEYNFIKMPQMRLLAPYDLSSLMHYDITTFSKNGEPTIRAIDDRMTFLIGSRRGFSFYDVYTINKMYNCSAGCPASSPVCDNEGFLQKSCTCMCPRGLAGATCDRVVSTAECGGIIDVINSTFLSSPNFPEPYGDGLRCTWLLKSPPGTIIQIEFMSMDVEKSSRGTCRDRLEIRYHHIGISQGPIFCGTDLPVRIASINNRVIVHFDTNRRGRPSHTGFNLSLTLQAKPTCADSPCGNGGICTELDDLHDYVCVCIPGWIGHDCELPVLDGGLSPWSPWSECVASCAIQDRVRTCSDPSPANGGLMCEGDTFQTRRCGTPQECQDQFFCDFGTQTNSSSCDIYEDDHNAIAWLVNFGATPSLGTGPAAGHTTGDHQDMYFYLEASNGRKYDKGIVWLPEQNWGMGMHCLQFFYSMHGESVATLAVIRGWTGQHAPSTLWQRTGHQGEMWREAHLGVEFYSETVKLGFLAVRGDAYDADIAIDDVSISTGVCAKEPTTYGCVKPGTDGVHIGVGPFSYVDGCVRLNCFCNLDAYVDCPGWMHEDICQSSEQPPLINQDQTVPLRPNATETSPTPARDFDNLLQTSTLPGGGPLRHRNTLLTKFKSFANRQLRKWRAKSTQLNTSPSP